MTAFASARLLRRLAPLLTAALFAAPALAFDVADVDGKRLRLADYRGKWVVVNFWATWCTPCIKEIPELAAFHRENAPDRAVVIGVAFDVEDGAKVRQFAKKVGHAYPLVFESEDTERDFGRAKALPTTFVYDPSGKRVWQRTGTVTKKSLEEVIGGARSKT